MKPWLMSGIGHKLMCQLSMAWKNSWDQWHSFTVPVSSSVWTLQCLCCNQSCIERQKNSWTCLLGVFTLQHLCVSIATSPPGVCFLFLQLECRPFFRSVYVATNQTLALLWGVKWGGISSLQRRSYGTTLQREWTFLKTYHSQRVEGKSGPV